MKKKYLLIGSLALMQYFAKAQTPKDTNSPKLQKTEIEMVYNHYWQDGNNSAVTGGIGTEKLSVYGPALYLKNTTAKHSFALNIGTDLVTSASTDKIDFVVSSASRKDFRNYAHINYAKELERQNLNINGGLGISFESDYLSTSATIGFSKTDKQKLRSFSAQLQIYRDDLRWGRLRYGFFNPKTLIYPVELRYKEWYDVYKRNSYNLKLGFTQIINQRNTIGIFPEFTYQKGLLATPFHRIYFADATQAVENLPNERLKLALALKYNTFIGGKVILKNTINNYVDNFGILAIAFEQETAIKLKSFLTLLPGFRIYAQRGTKYFAPMYAHAANAQYYTSDFDLADLQTYSAGIAFKYAPQKYFNAKWLFNTLTFRYNFLYRSNGLQAQTIAVVFQSSVFRKRKTQ